MAEAAHSAPRVTALLAALILVLAPGAIEAAENPEDALHGFFDTLEAGRLDELDGSVCDEYLPSVRARFDVSSSLPATMGGDRYADAVVLIVTDREVELIERSNDRAVVRVGGQLRAIVDPEVIRQLAETSLEAFSVDVDPGQVQRLVEQLTEQLWSGSVIADEVTVVREGDAWRICDDIAVGTDATAAGSSRDGMCAYLTVAELNVIDEQRGGAGFAPYARSSWDDESGLCTYDEGEGGIGSVQVGRVDFPFDELAAAVPGGSDETVAGRRAYLSGNDLFVELPDGLLYVTAPAKGIADGAIDYLTMPAGVAELVLSRLDR